MRTLIDELVDLQRSIGERIDGHCNKSENVYLNELYIWLNDIIGNLFGKE